MLPGLGPMGAGAEPPGGPTLGSGGPKPPKEKPFFDIPDEEELIKQGQANIEKIQRAIAWISNEGTDVQCGASIVGDVERVFPAFKETLTSRDISTACVQGVWVLPEFVLKDLVGHDPKTLLPWRSTRDRIGAFLKNDFWRRLNAEVEQGLPIDWQKMALQPDFIVVVKVKQPLRQLASQAWAKVTRKNSKAVASAAYSLITFDNFRYVAVSCWPFRWRWLVVWVAMIFVISSSYAATSAVVPVTKQDVLSIVLVNLGVVFYSLKFRGEADAALGEAAAFKRAGSIALRRGKRDMALEQYKQGDVAAAKLEGMVSSCGPRAGLLHPRPAMPFLLLPRLA